MKKTLTGLHESYEPIKTDMIRFCWGKKPRKVKPIYIKNDIKIPRVPNDLSIPLLVVVGFAFVIMAILAVRVGETEERISRLESNSYSIIISESSESISETPTVTTAIEPTATPTLAGMFIPSQATAFKTYMDYRAITDKTSEQWKLQQIAETNDLGFRTCDGCYLVAVGSFYSSNRIGKRLVITFDTGNSIQVIVGDVKRDEHVINGQYHEDNGNILEFIIDKEVMAKKVLDSGDVSSLGLDGKVVQILEVRK